MWRSVAARRAPFKRRRRRSGSVMGTLRECDRIATRAAAVSAAERGDYPGMTVTTDPVKALVAGYGAATPTYG